MATITSKRTAIADEIVAEMDRRGEVIEQLEAEISRWRECAQYDAMMGGPKFKGWDRSALDRCRREFIEANQRGRK